MKNSRTHDRLKKLVAIICCLNLLFIAGLGGLSDRVYAGTDIYGLKTTIPEDFDPNDGENPYGNGKPMIPMGTMHEAFVLCQDGGTRDGTLYDFKKSSNIKGKQVPKKSNMDSSLYKKMIGGDAEDKYVNMAAYDAENSGRDDWVATIGFKSNGDMIVRSYKVKQGAYSAKKTKTIDMGKGDDCDFWDSLSQVGYKAYSQIATGDFTGDGKDEIAIYVPKREEFGSGIGPHVEILDGQTLGTKKTLDFGSLLGPEAYFAAEFTYDSRQARATPQASLACADVDRDGIDDLLVAAGWADLYEGGSVTDFEQRESWLGYYSHGGLNNDHEFFSLYDCQKNDDGDILEEKAMRTASVTTVDFDYDGFEEVVVAGYYAEDRADDDLVSDKFMVATLDWSTAGKKLQGPNFFTIDMNKYTRTGFYPNSDTMHAPPAVTGAAVRGRNAAEWLFLNGTFYEWNNSRGFVKKINTEVIKDSDRGMGSYLLTNTWVDSCVAGVFDSNELGAEQVLFFTGSKQDSVDSYFYRSHVAGAESVENADGYWSVNTDSDHWYETDPYGGEQVWHTSKSNNPGVAACAVDADDDTLTMKYASKEYQYSDAQVLALLQAAPYFSDLESRYGSVGATGFGESTGTTHTVTNNSSLTLGLFVTGSKDFGSWKFTGQAGYEHSFTWSDSTADSRTFSWKATNNSKKNKVVITRIPYIMYYYDVYEPGSDKPEGAVIGVPQEPEITTMDVDKYNELVSADKAKTKDDLIKPDVENCIAGEPSTYLRSTAGLDKCTIFEGNWMAVDNRSGGSAPLSQDMTTGHTVTEGSGYSNSIGASITISKSWGPEGAKASFGVGGKVGASWATATVDADIHNVTKSGQIVSPPEAEELYRFSCKVATWEGKVGKTEFPVVGYILNDYAAPFSKPKNVTVDTVTTDSATISWKPGYRAPQYYEVYQYIDDPYTGPDYSLLGTVDADTTTFTYSGLEPDTPYYLCVRAAGYMDGALVKSGYTDPVEARTLAEGEAPIISSITEEQNVCVGDSAEFEVVARPSENASSGLSYTWQCQEAGTSSWANVANAKSSVLSLFNVTEKMNGNRYRVIVSETVKGARRHTYSNIGVLHVGKTDSLTSLAALNNNPDSDNYQTNHGLAGITTTEIDREVIENGADKKIRVTIGQDTYDFFEYENTITGEQAGEANAPEYIYRCAETGDDDYYVLNGLTQHTDTDTGEITGAAASRTKLICRGEHFETADGDIWGELRPSDYGEAFEQSTLEKGGKTYSLFSLNGETLYKLSENDTDSWYSMDADGQLAAYTGEDTDEARPVYDNPQKTYTEGSRNFDVFMLNGEEIYRFGAGALATWYTREPDANGNLVLTEYRGSTAGAEAVYSAITVTDGTSVYDKYVPISGDSGEALYRLQSDGSWHYRENGVYKPLTVVDKDTAYRSEDGSLAGIPGEISKTDLVVKTQRNVTTAGDPVKINVTVDKNSTKASTEGTISFNIANTTTGSVETATAQCGADGQAVLDWAPQDAGVYQITATFSGSDTLNPSLGSAVYYAIDQDNPDNELLVLEADDVIYGDTIELKLYKAHQDPDTGNMVKEEIGEGSTPSFTAAYIGSSEDAEQLGSNCSYTPKQTGQYLFTVKLGDAAATCTVNVTKRPVTFTAPSRSGLPAAHDADKVPASADIVASYTGDKSKPAIIDTDADKFNTEALLSISAHPELTADSPAGVYTTIPGYRTDEESAALISSFTQNYTGTFVNGRYDVEADKYAVKFESGANGKIRGYRDDNMVKITSGEGVTQGSKVSFTATPDEGFCISGWTITDNEGNELTAGTDYKINKQGDQVTVKSLSCSLNVRVDFERESFSLTFSAGSGGNISGTYITDGTPGTVVTSPETVPNGKQVRLTAAPEEGYVVKQWTVTKGNGSPEIVRDGTGGIYSREIFDIKPDADILVTVEFEAEETYDITAKVVDAEGKTLSGCNADIKGLTQSGKAKKGSEITIDVNAPDNVIVSEWRQYTSDSEYTVLQGSALSLTIANVQKDMNIVIVAEPYKTFKVHYSVQVDTGSVPDGIITASSKGNEIESGKAYVAYIPVDFSASGIPDDYQIQKWTVDTSETEETVVASGPEADSYSMKSLETETWVKLYLEKRPVLTYSAGDNGSIADDELASGSHFEKYRTADHVLTITPDKGYEIDAITVTGNYQDVRQSESAGTTTIALKAPDGGFDGDLDVKVTFKALPALDAEFSLYDDGDGTHGTISAKVERYKDPRYERITDPSATGGELNDVYLGSIVTVTVKPDNTYSVLSWTVNGEELFGSASIPPSVSMSEDGKSLKITVDEDMIRSGGLEVIAQNGLTGGILTFGAKGNSGGTVTAAKANGDPVRYGTIFGSEEEVTFTAKAANGSVLMGWEINGQDVGSDASVLKYTVPAESTTDVRAVFKELQPAPAHILSYGVVQNEEAHGTIRAEVSKMPVTGKGYYSTADYKLGDTIPSGKSLQETTGIKLTAEPEPGYAVKGWYTDSNALNPAGSGSEAAKTFEIPSVDADTDIYVQFVKIKDIHVSVARDGAGKGDFEVYVDGKKLSDKDFTAVTETSVTFDVAEHSTIKVKGIPENGNYYVAAWNGVKADSDTFQINDVTEDTDITVTFLPMELVDVRFNVPDGYDASAEVLIGSGQAQKSIAAVGKTVRIPSGQNAEFRITPQAGQMVDEWMITYADGTVIRGGSLGIENTMKIRSLDASAVISVTLKDIVAYKVPYEPGDKYTIKDISVTPDTLPAGYEHRVRENGTAEFTVVPAKDHGITLVSVNSDKGSGINLLKTSMQKDGSCKVTVSNVCKDIELTVRVVPKYVVTINTDTYGSLTVKDQTGAVVKSGSKVLEGTVLTMTAEPKARCEFTSWNIGKNPLAKKNTVTITGNTTIKASFKALPIMAKSTFVSKKRLKISWTKVNGADRYIVYVQKCNGKDEVTKKYKAVKKSVTSVTYKCADSRASYKYKVVALKKTGGRYKPLSTSQIGHVASLANKKCTNARSIKVKSSLITLKRGGKTVIKASVQKQKPARKLLTHTAKFRYRCSNTAVASVNARGVVTGKKAGNCTIFVQAVNGVWKTVKVTVK